MIGFIRDVFRDVNGLPPINGERAEWLMNLHWLALSGFGIYVFGILTGLL